VKTGASFLKADGMMESDVADVFSYSFLSDQIMNWKLEINRKFYPLKELRAVFLIMINSKLIKRHCSC
jgi:hypothetical protein